MLRSAEEGEEDFEFCSHEYQVEKPNGDFDWVAVYDLPESVAFKWCKQKYPDCKVSYYKTVNKIQC